MKVEARLVIERLEQMLAALRFERELADLDDAAYRKRLVDDGYLVEGGRWSRVAIETWIEKLSWVRSECDRRLASGDAAFFDTLHTYGTARYLVAHEEGDRYAERFGPDIRARQASSAALSIAQKNAAEKRRKIDDAKYDELVSTAKNDKQLAGLLGVRPETLSRYKAKRFS